MMSKANVAGKETNYRIDALDQRIHALESDSKSGSDLLIRIDERIKVLGEDIKAFKDGFVKKEEFEPVRKFVYGAISLALISIGGVILSLVLK